MNRVATEQKNVMILPVNGKVTRLVELPKKFDNLSQDITDGYSKWKHSKTLSVTNDCLGSMGMAEIVTYGPYDVSITDDLTTINWTHFGMNNSVEFIRLMQSKYNQFEFIIAKMRPTKSESKTPICYDCETKTNRVILPTFHIHNQKPEENPYWDHHIVVVNAPPCKKTIHTERIEDWQWNFPCLQTLAEHYSELQDINHLLVRRWEGTSRMFPNVDTMCNYNKIQ
jgi:hypothetical protein